MQTLLFFLGLPVALALVLAWLVARRKPAHATYNDTSAIAASIDFLGTKLLLGVGASPITYTLICNVGESLSLPLQAEKKEITNAGDLWKRYVVTLLDMGDITFTIYWVMKEPTHANAITAGVTGLRYMFLNGPTNGAPYDFAFQYPDGAGGADSSADYFSAYVTKFAIKGQVGGVYTAEISLSNSGPPANIA